MENFIVSARKYRPTNFESVVGQSHITNTLQNAIKNNHLAQAFLFCGPRGVGKTTCARILAKVINEVKDDPNENVLEQNNSLNIYELDAASNNSVDDIRNLVDQVRYPPQTGKYKVYIIDEVHMLSNSAFNAFLKTLEEPPSYAIFILATTEKHKVIPTIISRCQVFDFNRIQISDMARHLAGVAEKEGIKAEPDALHLIAEKADGALRDALSIFDLVVTFSTDNSISYKSVVENLHILDHDYFFKITEQLFSENIHDALLVFDEIIRNGFDGHQFVVGLGEHFRNLLIAKDDRTRSMLNASENLEKKYEEQAALIDLSYLVSALNIVSSCDNGYKNAKNHRLHVEMALIKINYLKQAIDLSEQLNSIQKTAAVKDRVPSSYKIQDENSKRNLAKGNFHKRNIPKIEDINTVKAKLEEEKHTEYKSKNAEPEKKRNTEFDIKTLREKWLDFNKKFKETGDFKYSQLLESGTVEIIENSQVLYTLDNPLQVSLFEQLKSDLTEFLRNSLENDFIQIQVEQLKTEKESNTGKLYTETDKVKYLEENNPIFKKLKDRLGLELN